MAQYGCAGSLQVCALRGVRLDADCSPNHGPYAAFASSALASITSTPEIEEGEEFQLKNGCGVVTHYKKDNDRVKRQNISIELVTYDFELIEIMTGDRVLVDSTGKTIGIAQGGPNTVPNDGVYLEAFTKAVEGDDSCAVPTESPIPGWFEWIWPRGFFTLRDFTLENNFANVKLEGYSLTNSQLPDDGPFGDWPWDSGSGVAEWNEEDTRVIVLQPDGPPDTGCGYITLAS